MPVAANGESPAVISDLETWLTDDIDLVKRRNELALLTCLLKDSHPGIICDGREKPFNSQEGENISLQLHDSGASKSLHNATRSQGFYW